MKFILETKKFKAKQKMQTAEKLKLKGKPPDEMKFETYFNFKIPVPYIKPHQVRLIF